MFFILSKILLYLLLPMVWIAAILIYAVFTKNAKRRKKSLIICLVMLFFFGNSFIINQAFLWWEKPPVLIASLGTYDTAIVLSGVASTQKIDDRVYFSKGADRLLHTVQLYKMGKVRRILISGGSGALMGEKIREADLLKKVFIYCGVPEKDIITESQSRNTYENAQFTKKIVDSLDMKGNYLLVTSAFHMRRAQGCFTKAGLTTDIFPVDFSSSDWHLYDPFDSIIPSEGAIGAWTLLIHEITGYVVYKIMGYS